MCSRTAESARSGGLDRSTVSQAPPGQVLSDCRTGAEANSTTVFCTSTGYTVGLTKADIADALNAAPAVSDDRILAETQGQVNPETWTHRSSAQRQHWFTAGFQGGNRAACNTLAGEI